MNENLDCIIIADGLFPTSKSIFKLIENNKYIIVCDGAIKNVDSHNIIPHTIIGDLDSIDQKLKNKYSDIIIYNKDQETNDLTKSVMYAKEKGFKNILILGATGLREDHTLGNISLLINYRDLFDSIIIMSDFGYFISINKTTTFKSIPGQQISIFTLPELINISSEGLLYEFKNRTFPLWWEGTLNQAISDSFTLQLEGKGNVIVYFSNTIK